MEMLVSEDITEYIFQILSERKFFLNQNKVVKINLHCNDDTYSKDTIKKRVDSACASISEEFEIEGPLYTTQSCFLSKKQHSHIEFTIKMSE